VTADRRLRIGGWAALLVAILAPLQLVALFLSAHDADPFAATPYLLVETLRVGAILVAVIGLDALYRSIAPGVARFALVAGGLGASIGLIADAVTVGGVTADSLGTLDTVLFLAANVLIGVWFFAGGGILMREGGGLVRVGWTAELGGLGVIVTALAIATDFGGPIGSGSSWIDWFHLLGLFVVVYLVRIWRYVVGGKLPGPGIL
jgi:hypothetical protein